MPDELLADTERLQFLQEICGEAPPKHAITFIQPMLTLNGISIDKLGTKLTEGQFIATCIIYAEVFTELLNSDSSAALASLRCILNEIADAKDNFELIKIFFEYCGQCLIKPNQKEVQTILYYAAKHLTLKQFIKSTTKETRNQQHTGYTYNAITFAIRQKYSGKIKSLTLSREIDHGSYGVVLEGKISATLQSVAIKISYNKNTTNDEAELLKKLAHPNIIGYIDHFSGVLILELADTCLYFWTSSKECNPVLIPDILKQIAAGILYLTENMITHNDLKTDNVLLCPGIIAKITDFGLATKFKDDRTALPISRANQSYRSPELFTEKNLKKIPLIFTHAVKVQIYAFAIMFWKLYYPEINEAWDAWGLSTQAYRLSGKKLPLTDLFTADMKALFNRCSDPRPKNRPAPKELVVALDSTNFKK